MDECAIFPDDGHCALLGLDSHFICHSFHIVQSVSGLLANGIIKLCLVGLKNISANKKLGLEWCGREGLNIVPPIALWAIRGTVPFVPDTMI